MEVIASYVHDILDIQRTTVSYSSSYALTAGTSLFYTYTNILGGYITLDRSVLDPNYVWVIKNSNLLIPGIDYKLNDDLQSIQIQKPLYLISLGIFFVTDALNQNHNRTSIVKRKPPTK